jgi:D-glycero-alpha-D-manno-heptose-7-phosphate kinase
MIISKTPYRLSLFGGGTDYPAWYEKHPSKIISAAMAHYCYISLKKLPPYFEHANRIIYSKIETVNDISEIEHPSVRECLKYHDISNGISISHDGDLPARSGIGSSSAFTVGLIHALQTYQKKLPTPYGLASSAIDVEQNFIGESVGVQDQITAAYGGINVIELSKDNIKVSTLDIPFQYEDTLEKYIMLGFSGIDRFSDVHAKQQVENIKSGKSEKYLKKIRDLADDAYCAFLGEEPIEQIGALLDIQWHYKRQLTNDITTEYIDNIYQKARAAGAYGGKLMGAGGGGFFMFLASPEKHDIIKQAIPEINIWVPFKFDYSGSTIIME